MPNTAKAEAIRKAYGEYWEQLSQQAKKCALEHNGYISPIISGIGNIPREFVTFNDLGFRPRTIVGIENNNGWIRIESEDDLPKEDKIECWFIHYDRIYNGAFAGRMFSSGATLVGWRAVTHFQPIVKPEKPIY